MRMNVSTYTHTHVHTILDPVHMFKKRKKQMRKKKYVRYIYYAMVQRRTNVLGDVY